MTEKKINIMDDAMFNTASKSDEFNNFKNRVLAINIFISYITGNNIDVSKLKMEINFDNMKKFFTRYTDNEIEDILLNPGNDKFNKIINDLAEHSSE